MSPFSLAVFRLFQVGTKYKSSLPVQLGGDYGFQVPSRWCRNGFFDEGPKGRCFVASRPLEVLGDPTVVKVAALKAMVAMVAMAIGSCLTNNGWVLVLRNRHRKSDLI